MKVLIKYWIFDISSVKKLLLVTKPAAFFVYLRPKTIKYNGIDKRETPTTAIKYLNLILKFSLLTK